jgi:hypothetical protein
MRMIHACSILKMFVPIQFANAKLQTPFMPEVSLLLPAQVITPINAPEYQPYGEALEIRATPHSLSSMDLQLQPFL